MHGRQIKRVLPACPLAQVGLGAVILRDCLFMLKMLKSGFVSFGKMKRSPQVPNLLRLLDYQASQGGKAVIHPKPGKEKAAHTTSGGVL